MSIPVFHYQNISSIHIKGARHHNLKNINLDIPRNHLVVICGLSGSGKSTLAFDIIYAEGQRRYIESLSVYARQFLPRMDKPLVDKIEGLSPAIALKQHILSNNPRSTVGTVTEIYDCLRVFYARLGIIYCPTCNVPIHNQTLDQIVDELLTLPEGTRFMLLAPLVKYQKVAYQDYLKKLKLQGFVRVRIDGKIYSLDPLPTLQNNKKYTIELVVDRLVMKPNLSRRLADSVELTLAYGDGHLIYNIIDSPNRQLYNEDRFLSTIAICSDCKRSLPTLNPQLFSFNSPQNACPRCLGLGIIESFEPDLIAPNKSLSICQGGLIPWKSNFMKHHCYSLKALGQRWKFDLDTPLYKLSHQAWHCLFYGDNEICWEGITSILDTAFKLDNNICRNELTSFRQISTCPNCAGSRLKPEALAVRIDEYNLFEFCSLSITRALAWLAKRTFIGARTAIAEPLIKELTSKLNFMVDVGLDYLSLARNMSTLSGGEAQRIRLARQLGSGLVGIIYILDEPSIGLHPSDNARLLATLRNLQAQGNTIIVVEHDEATIRAADYVIELGPGSGVHGGEVVFSGSVPYLLKAPYSLTAQYLRCNHHSTLTDICRTPTGYIYLTGVTTNNLQNLNVAFPLGCLTCITGPSGSGKSSLVIDTLYKHIALACGNKIKISGILSNIEGVEQIERIIAIDQTPIGCTPRSNPATYTKIFNEIRKIFHNTSDARQRGFKPSRFSFNVSGGRCEACQGDGYICVKMHFLSDVYVKCEACKGKRYNRETLDVRYKGLNIAEVLNLSVHQARIFFQHYPRLERYLSILEEVGLDYITLGQPATTLSGGEAQRIKISYELGKRNLPRTLYVFDEPTTGLHMYEVSKLIQVLYKLIDKGATVIIIEHNLSVIYASDYVIDLGPGGGEFGGYITSQGTPKQLIDNPNSITGIFLKNYIERIKH